MKNKKEVKKFTISIEETVVKSFEVFADNADAAMKIAKEKYRSGEFVLEPGTLLAKKMSVSNQKNDVTEWIEF